MRRPAAFPGFLGMTAILVVSVLLLSVLLLARYERYRSRQAVARVRKDMRSVATALESYAVDWCSYPPATRDPSLMAYGLLYPPDVPIPLSFQGCVLTTPVPYLTSFKYCLDPFTAPVYVTWRYYTIQCTGWILASCGPDTDWREGGQIGFHDGAVEWIYDPVNCVQPSDELLVGESPRGAHTYDPTNGFLSSGDVWRVKQ